jgi:hypothetical protein
MRRVFDLVALAPKSTVGGERWSELGADGAFDGDVPACAGGAQTLVGEERGTCLPRGVIGQYEGVRRVAVEQRLGGRESHSCPMKSGTAVGRVASDWLKLTGGKELLDVGFAGAPAPHCGTTAPIAGAVGGASSSVATTT